MKAYFVNHLKRIQAASSLLCYLFSVRYFTTDTHHELQVVRGPEIFWVAVVAVVSKAR